MVFMMNTRTGAWIILTLQLVPDSASCVNFHVLLQGVASVERFRAKVTGERLLSTVDEHVRLQVVLQTEPLGTLGTCKGSCGILSGRVILCNGLVVALCVLGPHFKI